MFGFDVEDLAESVGGGSKVDETVSVEVWGSDGEFGVGGNEGGLTSGGVRGNLVLEKVRGGSTRAGFASSSDGDDLSGEIVEVG